MSFNEENLFKGILPKRIVIGLVDSASYEGAYNKNPFNFKNNNIQYCSLILDGKMIPQRPLISDFTNNNTLRNYLNLLESVGKVFINNAIGIDRSEYEEGYSLLAFDLTPYLSESGCYHVIRKGNIWLGLKFGTALPSKRSNSKIARSRWIRTGTS